MRRLLVVPIVVALGCGAQGQYVYAPEATNAQQGGLPASRVMIPPEQPQGSVEITSSGVTRITPDNRAPIDVIHVRMTVSNDGDQIPWRVDTRDQILEIPSEGQSRPLFANSDVQAMPIISVAQAQRHVIDLFFPLPARLDASHLPQFDLVWRVDTAARAVAQRTSFDRESDASSTDGYAVGYGTPYWYPYDYASSAWGPYWWYDPMWGGVAWAHPRVWWGGRAWRGNVRVGSFAGRYRAGGFHGGGVAHGGGGHGGGGHR
jgi:uncharacterized membrane protein YgcG